MITFQNCIQSYPIERSVLNLVNKVAFDRGCGFTAGHDRGTYWDFARNLDRHLRHIQKHLLRGTYRFDPFLKKVRWIKSTKSRDIFISVWKDRVVERWLYDSLSYLLRDWFALNCYAYRVDNIGIDLCQRRVAETISSCRYFVKRDISSYFYTIDHDILMAQLRSIINPDDYLIQLLSRRIQYEYYWDNKLNVATMGVPFGSSLACLLANIYLTSLDKLMINQKVRYFRYADDFLIAGKDPEVVHDAANVMDQEIGKLKLKLSDAKTDNYSFDECPGYKTVSRFKYLGLQFCADAKIRLSVEKQRKIIRFYKMAIKSTESKLRKESDVDKRLEIILEAMSEVVHNRIRSVAIIDYYLKHITDEQQLKMLDRRIAEMIIECVLDKKFRNSDFRKIPFKKLRQMGLESLLHRHRLIKHGHLKVDFISLYNMVAIKSYLDRQQRRRGRFDLLRVNKKLRKDVVKKHIPVESCEQGAQPISPTLQQSLPWSRG